MQAVISLAQRLQGQSQQPPPPPPLPPYPAESSIESVVVAVPSPPLSAAGPKPPPRPPPANLQLDLPTLVVAFCLSGAIQIAIQNHNIYPLGFHLLCLTMVCAFASILVAKYIAPKQPKAACLLDHLGIFFGVTAFFFAAAMSFPLGLRVISWIIYALSLIAVLFCNFPIPPPFGGL